MELNLKDKTPDIRYLNDMKDVLYDKQWAETADNLELYYMYRALKMKEELRYDITVIPPQMLGREFVRTKGNRNSKNLPELYTVLEGEAIFLMQQTEENAIDTIKDVVAIKTKSGESVIIPATHAVIMINPSKQTLKTANWVSDKNENIYEELKIMKGACYFYTTEGWIKNKNYKEVPELRFEEPKKEIPEDLTFLKG